MVILSRRYRKQQLHYGQHRYNERNVVERFINKVKWYRRIATRDDKLTRRFMPFLLLAATRMWLQQNVNDPPFRPWTDLPLPAQHLSHLENNAKLSDALFVSAILRAS